VNSNMANCIFLQRQRCATACEASERSQLPLAPPSRV